MISIRPSRGSPVLPANAFGLEDVPYRWKRDVLDQAAAGEGSQ
ncbi:MAG: hypothetical protein ABR610_10825 [Thermoanaerobaculia bacterium]